LFEPSNYEDVVAFHRKFCIPVAEAPAFPPNDILRMRLNFLLEELVETGRAAGFTLMEGFAGGPPKFFQTEVPSDLPGFFDGLIDLVYVAMGTADMAGLPWQAGWDAVQAANMKKQRAVSASVSKRGHQVDVVKPEGWTPPDIEEVVSRAQLGSLACGAENGGRRCIQPYTHRGHIHTDGLLTWVASPCGHAGDIHGGTA
jgi:predicted HAD superfamily Cof-like phosphohydrolase